MVLEENKTEACLRHPGGFAVLEDSGVFLFPFLLQFPGSLESRLLPTLHSSLGSGPVASSAGALGPSLSLRGVACKCVSVMRRNVWSMEETGKRRETVITL